MTKKFPCYLVLNIVLQLNLNSVFANEKIIIKKDVLQENEINQKTKTQIISIIYNELILIHERDRLQSKIPQNIYDFYYDAEKKNKSTEVVKSGNDETTLEFDFIRIRKPFPEGQYESQKKYWAAFSFPKPFLTDYYGLHCFNRLKKERVLRDFVPLYAEILTQTDKSARLRFKDGFSFDFHFGKNLVSNAKIIEDSCDFAWTVSETVEDLIDSLNGLQNLLSKTGLEKEYLLPNPFFLMEKTLVIREKSLIPPAHFQKDPDLSLFSKDLNGIVFIPDGVHGNIERYEQLYRVLNEHRMDWFAIEMFTSTKQKALDTFIFGQEDSLEFLASRKALIEASWKGKFPDEDHEHPEQNRYFKLIELCRQQGIRVIGMESGDKSYVLWGHGETPFGVGVRNVIWAKTIPTIGKGVVFGGSAHFIDPLNPQKNSHVQDFIQEIRPNTQFYVK
jgi:hypothetical protein